MERCNDGDKDDDKDALSVCYSEVWRFEGLIYGVPTDRRTDICESTIAFATENI